MSLYALGDLHLSFQSDKSMDIFGSVWKRHERKIEKYVNRIVKPDDTLVLTGDHSWGRLWCSPATTPGEESCLSAGRISLSSSGCRGTRSCSGETMTCSGTRRRRSG